MIINENKLTDLKTNEIKNAVEEYKNNYEIYENGIDDLKRFIYYNGTLLKKPLEQYFKGADITIDEEIIYINYNEIQPNLQHIHKILKNINPIITAYEINQDNKLNTTNIKIHI